MNDVTSRRNDLRSKIVEIAAQFLHEQGPAAVTTRGVAEAAGVQAPMIYRIFGDKDGLLEAVAEHVMATYVSAKAAVVQAASAGNVDPVQDLRAGWLSQIDFGVANPYLFQLLSDPDRAHRSPAVLSGRRILEARVHRVAATGRLRVSEQHAVALIHAAGTGVIQTLLATPVDDRDPALGASMYEAVLQQILTDAPPAADAGPIAVTVAFRAVAPQLDMLSGGEQRLLGEWLDRAVEVLERERQ
jgi:AcrR family transcriptional regulator